MSVNFIKRTRRALFQAELALTSREGKIFQEEIPWKIPTFIGIAFAISFIKDWQFLLIASLILFLFSLLLKIPIEKTLVRAGILGILTFLLFLPSLFLGMDAERVGFLALRSFFIIWATLIPVFSLGWQGIIRSLKKLKFPSLLLLLLDISTRFIFLLFKVAKENWEGAESRVFNPSGKMGRRITAHLISSLFIRTFLLVEETHQAMIARGYADF
ncbi:MAG: hypothetical protein NUV68_02840 [Caldiserica bacterium]|nr:hypothetical protein [Caldisericota bacterium]MDH7562519.1 CbiQ family ECF transporter T component [Caldisericota bacterium]